MTNKPQTPQQRSLKGMRFTSLAVLINVGLAMTKGIAGIVGNSYALIADAAESALDIFSSIAVLSGLKIASIPPDENHPYGHGKAEPLAALVVSIVLMCTAVVLVIGSVREMFKINQQAPASFTLYVLVIVVIIKEILFRLLFKAGKETDSTAVQADAWHHRSDALTSLAAFAGISIALVGGKGYESADDWAAIVAAGVIVSNAYRIFRPALNEIMDATPSDDVESAVRGIAMTVNGVSGLDVCHVRKMGLAYYVDLHVLVDGSMQVRQGHQIAHDVKDKVKRSNPAIMDVFIHVEPDVVK